MKRREKACIVDVDGTLIDSERRFRLAQRGNMIDWELALDPKIIMKFDRPMPRRVIDQIVSLCREAECQIVVVTGRPERLREVTIMQLERIGLREGEYILVMRENGDYRREIDYKISRLMQLSRMYDIAVVIDDNLDFLKHARTLFRRAKLYHVSKDRGVRQLEECDTGSTILDYIS